jgi:poly-beta-1,6-N-acetyl-D-glucosamine synthase
MHGALTVAFLISAGFVAYTLAGYPMLLAAAARFRRRPVEKRFEAKTVTILLPVRNGERWLRAKLESLLALRYPAELVQILVISDGSTDGTEEIACQYAGRIEFLRTQGGGKAVALNAGLERARGDILFLTDVRQPIDPNCLKHLVACFADPSVGVVSGELVINEGPSREEASVGLYWKYEKWLRKLESRIDSVMGATGCIYAMRRELAAPLPPGTLVDDMFLPLTAFFKGYRVILEDSAMAFDYPTALDAEFRRKVRTQAGVYQIIGMFPQLLLSRNRMWLAFVSHKLARLFLPFALIVAAVTSFYLDDPWRSIAIAAQAAFYATALLDLWVPDSAGIKSLSATARSFVVLMAAALCAPLVLVRPPGEIWKETEVRPADRLP